MFEQIKSKVSAFFAFVSPYAAKAYAVSPFLLGLVTGYFGHGLIKAGLDTALFLVKTVIKF